MFNYPKYLYEDSFSGMLGTAGGAGGTGFKAPQNVGILAGTNQVDVGNAQNATTGALSQQQNLLNALYNQQGLNRQNTASGYAETLANQMNAANGLGTQGKAISGLQGVAGQQANTANMYQNIANGTGPNPAQAMLNQQTGQNVANQAALMAGQRGAGANVGLMARQAAQQGAATQQQAVGQGATMQANQQLNALSGLSSNQAQQAQTQQAIGGLGTTQVGQQMAAQQNFQNQANQIAGQQIAGTNAMTQAQMANTGQLQNALASYNTSNVAQQGSVNAANAGMAQTRMGNQGGLTGGILGGIGSAVGLAAGGEVHHYDDGGAVAQSVVPPPAAQAAVAAPAPPAGPQSTYGKFLKGVGTTMGGGSSENGLFNMAQAPGDKALQEGMTSIGKGIKKRMDKPGEAPEGDATQGSAVDNGSLSLPAMGNVQTEGPSPNMAEGGLAASGGHVKAKGPSQKAVKSGNSYDNDKVPAMLSEGEYVLDREIMNSPDPALAAYHKVKSFLASKGAKK